MVHIKESNLNKILSFANGNNNEIQGSKLEALYTLIQKKGIEISESENTKLIGIKAMELPNLQHIGIVYKGYSKNFYPCTINIFIAGITE